MWNIIYIDVDKLDINFEFPKYEETMNELEKLKNNILKLVENENTLLVFTSKEDLNEVKYNAALLINYFNAVTLNQENIIIGNLLTKDAIVDVCIRNNDSTYYTISVDDISQKQYDIIKTIGKENISKLVHITDGIEYFFARKVSDLDNISLYTGYDSSLGNIQHDMTNGNNITYLNSKEQGIKGFNDCFNTYFNYKKSQKLARE